MDDAHTAGRRPPFCRQTHHRRRPAPLAHAGGSVASLGSGVLPPLGGPPPPHDTRADTPEGTGGGGVVAAGEAMMFLGRVWFLFFFTLLAQGAPRIAPTHTHTRTPAFSPPALTMRLAPSPRPARPTRAVTVAVATPSRPPTSRPAKR